MSTERIYESNPEEDYAASSRGHIVSRSLFAVIERGDMPLDGGFGEAEIVEATVPGAADTDAEASMRVRIDTVPQDTMARNPDDAARAAQVMQGLSNERGAKLGFKVEYLV